MHRFGARALAVLAVLALGSCSDGSGPSEPLEGTLTVVARFDAGVKLVDPGQAHVLVTRADNGSTVADATVPIPVGADSVVRNVDLTLASSSQQFNVTLELLSRSSGQVAFRVGPQSVTVSQAGVRAVASSFPYVGTGANATGVRFLTTAAGVLGGDSVLFTAEAFDGTGATVAGAPILWTVSDPVSATIANAGVGRVVAANVRATVQVRASLLPTQATPTPPNVSGNLVIQPKPTAIQVQAGNNQNGTAGAALPTQIKARVVAGDNIGVAGIVVAFAVGLNSGTVSAPLDTTDANGDVSVTWTLGGLAGNQTASATVAGLAGGVVNFAATAAPGAPARLAFVQEPTPALEGIVIAPAVTVRAVDAFGNPTPSFASAVTLALLTPAGATLSGTLTRTATANLATFDDLSINVAGPYQLRATSGALATDTSVIFTVFANVPALVTFNVQPANVRAGVNLASVVVAVRNGVGNIITTSNGLPITLALGVNPGPGTLAGTTTVNTVAGLATFAGLTITKSAAGYALVATSGALTPDTSSPFTVAPDSARALAFGTVPSSVRFEAPFDVTVEARDQFGNVSPEIAGNVTVAIGTNPSSGKLFGTVSAAPVQGVATFAGLSIDNIGAGYTLGATATGVTSATSAAIDVIVPNNSRAWVNPAGGAWSVAANWSGGVVPGAGDTVFIHRSGTYTVTQDVNATNVRVDVGGVSGAQTLSINPAVTLTGAGGGVAINDRGRLTLNGNAIVAGSSLTVALQSFLTIVGGGAIAAPYDIDGYVSVQSGLLSFALGSVPGTGSSGVMVVNAGATLSFTGGNNTLDAASSITGPGAVQVTAGSVNVAGPWSITSLTITGGALSYGAASGTLGALNLGSGLLAVGPGGLLTVAGPMSWAGGNLGGSGTLRVAPAGTLAVTTGAPRQLDGLTLELLGTGDIAGNLTITLANAAVLRVGAGATLTIPASLQLEQGAGPPGLFHNLGTVSRDAATLAVFTAPYQNDGVTTLNSGTLRILTSESTSSSGSWSVAASAVLDFNTGTHLLTGTVSGAGNANITGATVTAIGGWNVAAIFMDNGTFDYSAGLPGNIGQFTFAGGTLTGTGTINVSGAMTWSGGNMLGTGTTRVLGTGTLAITNATGGPGSLSARTLEVLGNTSLSGTFTLSTGNGASIRNGAGATFTISGDPTVQYTLGGAVPVFENLGTVVRNTSAGTATIGMRFDHSGPGLTVSTGTLALTQGGTHSGPISIAAGAVWLDYAGGTFTVSSTFGGTGAARLQAGSIVTATAADTARFVALTLNGGTLAPLGGAVVSGPMTWSGDAGLTGTGTVRLASTATLNITGALSKTFTNGVLRNDGAVTYSGSGAINTGQGAQITNNALFNWTGDGAILSNQGGAVGRFANAAGGTLRRSVSVNPAVLDMATDKLGAFDIQTGSLELRRGILVNLVGAVTGGGKLTLAGAGQTYPASGNLAVAGGLEVNDADLTLAGHTVGVAGTFVTSGVATLTMTNVADSLGVGGNATFGGGSSAGRLTNGVVSVGGNFTQSGNAASFAPSIAHRMRFNGASNQTVTFTNPTTSFFDSVIVNKGSGARSALQLASNIRVNRGMVVQGSSEIASSGSTQLKVLGKLRVMSGATNPLVHPLVLELSDTPNIDSMAAATDGIQPDTVAYVDNVPQVLFGTPLRYKSVRISVNGTITPQPTAVTQVLGGDVVITSGTLNWNSLSGGLRAVKLRLTGGTLTQNSGTIEATDSTVITNGAANLLAGFLKLGGHVRQTGGQINGNRNHTTTLSNATVTQRILMTNAGFGQGQSSFGRFVMDNATSGGIDLGSSIVARVLGTTGSSNPRVFGHGFKIFTKGLSVGAGSQVTFDNTAIDSDTGDTDDTFDFATFNNPSQNMVFFTVRRIGGTSKNYNGLLFPAATVMDAVNARYIQATKVGGAAGIFQMFISGLPNTIGPDDCFMENGGAINWNGTDMACSP